MSSTRADNAATPRPQPDSIAWQDVAVRLESITKRFGDLTALADVSLEVSRGEFMTLLGPSGCGKTTLLNVVAGFLSPTSGEVFIGDVRVTEVPTYEREIGIVFQNYALFPHMSVANNVAYGLKARGIARAEIAIRVADMLAIMKLTGLEDRKPRQLSGGQQQRVALARALVIRPKVLLLDEPFSALDKNLRVAMQVEVKEIQRKLGVTTVFVTHDQGEALGLSDRVAVISDGRIRQVDTPQNIYHRPADRFVATFIGEGSVLRGRLERIDNKTAVVVGVSRVAVPGEPLFGVSEGALVDLLVRPEQLRIASENAAVEGKVAAVVFRGGHVDLYVDTLCSTATRVLVRLGGIQTAPKIGDRVQLAIHERGAIAFPSGA
jgi:spermidine/putrescine ABC transporter ATP-binding subunit